MKPTITKEQAGAIQIFMDGDKEKSDLLRIHAKDRWIEEFSCLNELDIMTLAAALVNGYEVKKTPEEKVREFYESFNTGFGTSHSETHFRFEEYQRVIKITLERLGIKIEGVNA
ncbi:hypothetical protein [Bacillus subtilis]|uniref:hypothetical protein n=1 Tax=Bacillus subtilis TaxID=1423 RepID=UPI00059C6A52|nr:hypothetical protein [Bacillus subtilis]KIN51194.1 hypothetical protein B4073_1718 [Bacillus subtilis]MBP3047346.1 hypothetical protein [Bacillus subtilis subsp. subtilis]MEC0429343.1 hypothetical protein [Bacillus subtilis]